MKLITLSPSTVSKDSFMLVEIPKDASDLFIIIPKQNKTHLFINYNINHERKHLPLIRVKKENVYSILGLYDPQSKTIDFPVKDEWVERFPSAKYEKRVKGFREYAYANYSYLHVTKAKFSNGFATAAESFASWLAAETEKINPLKVWLKEPQWEDYNTQGDAIGGQIDNGLYQHDLKVWKESQAMPEKFLVILIKGQSK